MEYLDGIKEKGIKDDPSLNLTKGAAWIPPPLNPLSQNLRRDANWNKFYLGNVWVYMFAPMKQYQCLVSVKYE